MHWHATTIVSVRDKNSVVIAGDGQVSMGALIIKSNATKIRKLKGSILVGFAGSTADAFSLLEHLEKYLEQYPDQLMRSCVAMAKEWRGDKYLRKLEAMMIVADKEHTFVLTGVGDVLEPEKSIAAIGSGGAYALSAARALKDNTTLSALTISQKSLEIAADLCVYTNRSFVWESLTFPSMDPVLEIS